MEAIVKFSEIKEEIINKLQNANNNIKLAMAWLTDEDIIRTLTKKQEAGKNVEIVISNSKENFKATKKFQNYLKNNGKLYISANPFLHHKFCLIDDFIIINGSYNWSYPARTNEENIMVITLDSNNKYDASLNKQFNEKFNALCRNKNAVLINDLAAFNNFLLISVDNNSLVSQLDENEINLRQSFEESVKESIAKSLKAKIPFDYTSLQERMKLDGGGVEFVKRILNDEIQTKEMKSGFNRLAAKIPHRVDLSLEYIVSRPKYHSLFTKKEINFCVDLMGKYGLLN